ncbi:MAG: hypothetical protein PSN34_06995 [Urechidicola sp.]|nr:hypothetical protein [Urechidicola sp.]
MINKEFLKKEFEREIDILLIKTTKEVYRPNYFYKLSLNVGGHYQATKILIPKLSDGFTKLLEKERTDLSIEFIVIKPKYKSLFTDDEIKMCKRKLRIIR